MSSVLAMARSTDFPVIPGFEIVRLLDQGGMGVVYQARQKSPDRLVALKVIRPDRRANPEAVRRFQREAKAAAQLVHPNVVNVFHAGRTGPLHYLVMEYVEGIDLARLVAHHGPVAVPPAVAFLRQAALGLQHLFDCGLVHRDIKPSNLILRIADSCLPSDERRQTCLQSAIRNLSTGVIKIVDLGLARHLRPGDDSSITQGGMIGTPDYIAPEQAESPHQVDIRSDIYSLGCTLYYLLTGRPPFPDGTMIHKLDMHRWGTPAPLARLRPDVPPSLAVIAARLLAKKPADRFQSPLELADALRPLQGDSLPAATVVIQPSKTRSDGHGKTVRRAKAVGPSPPADRFESGVLLRGHTSAVACVAVHPDGRHCASGSFDESIRLWDMSTASELHCFPGHPGGVTDIAFMAGGRGIVSCGRDGQLRIHDLHSRREKLALAGHEGEVHGLALAADGRRLVSAGQDQTVRLWDLRKGKEQRRIGGTVAERHWGSVLSIALASDGSTALSGGRDGTARLWDLTTGRERRCWRSHHAAVMAVDLAADNCLALSAAGLTICLWELATGELLKTLAGHTQPVLTARFTTDGRRILSAGQDGTVRIWDVTGGQELQCFGGNAGWVLAVAASPDGRLVVSGGADGSVRLWPTRGDNA